jgi:hypothetical protein
MIVPTHLLTLHPWWVPTFDPPMNKDVENRSWPLPASFRGGVLAFHAGLKPFDVIEYEGMIDMIRRAGFAANLISRRLYWSDYRAGGEYGEIRDADLPRGHIVGIAQFAVLPYERPESRWAVPGEHPWAIARWTKLAHPIPCRGGRGLVPIPADVREALAQDPSCVG